MPIIKVKDIKEGDYENRRYKSGDCPVCERVSEQ